MRVRTLHGWDISSSDAVELQRHLASRINTTRPLKKNWRLLAAADVSYNRFSNVIFAAVIIWDRKTGGVVESRSARRVTHFPYRTGLLTFREAPAVLDAFRKIKLKPDVVMIDGHGQSHPRRMGIASHLGLLLDLPTIGVAKSLLVGKMGILGPAADDSAELHHRDEVVAIALRTKSRCRPIYVSVGHKLDLTSAVGVVRETLRGYRLPAPARLVHLLVNAKRRAYHASQSAGRR